MAKGKVVMAEVAQLPKCPSGIQGLDEITFGGLPKGRPTLLCGGPGCGNMQLKRFLKIKDYVCLSLREMACVPIFSILEGGEND